MPTLPHDMPDLHFAPVVLALDARIAELGGLDLATLAWRVAVEGDCSDLTLKQRQAGLLRAVKHFVECHDWYLSWDPRGLRLSHDSHSIVLGVPANFSEYMESVPLATIQRH
jgi:hypothetical protein